MAADDVARENYEKYGHPDGPQSVKLDIALPDWVFSQVRHPLYVQRQGRPWDVLKALGAYSALSEPGGGGVALLAFRMRACVAVGITRAELVAGAGAAVCGAAPEDHTASVPTQGFHWLSVTRKGWNELPGCWARRTRRARR